MMKKSLVLLGLVSSLTSAFSGSFEGWSASGSIDRTSNKLTGGSVFDKTNKDLGLVVADQSNSKTGVKFGASYGIKLGPTLTSFGIDYSTAKTTNIQAITPAGNGSLSTDVKGSYGIYVAPGFQLDNSSLIYAKAGIQNYSYNINDATRADTPGNSGFVYGIGYKQFLDKNSPVYFVIEYVMGATTSGTTHAVDNSAHLDTKNQFSGLSFGIGYSFN